MGRGGTRPYQVQGCQCREQTIQQVFTLRVNSPALVSACHFVYFAYFVVSTAVFRMKSLVTAAPGAG